MNEHDDEIRGLLLSMTFSNFCRGGMFLALGIAALFYASHAKAEVVATGTNQAGGMVYLTTQASPKHCQSGELTVMSAGKGGANARFGCWRVIESLIFVRWWDDGSTSIWSPVDFDVKEEGEATPDFRL